MTGMNHITDPAMFERFHHALTSERAGYAPWYFLLSKGLKDPVAGISWKQLEGRLTFEQAIRKMRAGHNIGISATGMDPLCIVDVDDIKATPDEDVKPTLSTRSRKRIGRHYFYFTDDPRCKENLPTESKGEIRSSFEYVVAPGSFVLCNDKTIAAMPESEREQAGRYTVENERAPDTITFEELPPVFLEQAKKNREAEKETKKKREEKAKARKDKKPAQGSNKNKSAMWDLSIEDIMSIPNKARFKSLFHESTTGKNTALNGDGGLTCWRHLCTHTPLSALCVMAGVADCNSAGQGFNGRGTSCIDYTDGATLFKMWTFAKREGMIPKDDPIPAVAIRWYAVENRMCKPEEIKDGWKLPQVAYNKVLALIESEEEVSAGRATTTTPTNPIPTKRTTPAPYIGFGTDADFDISPETFLIGERGAFDTNEFAKWLIFDDSGFVFTTLLDTGEVLWYDEGVYHDNGEAEIQKIVEQVMDGTKVTRNAVNEVIGHIQRRTYTERDGFDIDKRIINLKNGLYDTKTGEMKPHTPKYLSMVRIPVTYDPLATCPMIDKFLSEILNAEDIDTAIEWFGYVLEPEYWIQSILMLLGEGGNGKSTFLSLLSVFVGKRNCANESIHNLANNRFRVATLHGKLANIYADIGSKELKDTGILKLLSGGDYISAEKKNKPPFEFKNFARMIFSANRLPRASDDTDAWYRRWTFINFTRKFGDDPDAFKKADKKLIDRLTTDSELSGLLNRSLDALKGLHERGGFSRNLSTEETRKIYTRLSDPVAVFLEDCCMIGPKETVAKSVLFNAYIEFCKVNRQASIGQSAFTRRIKDMGRFSDCQVGSKGSQERGWRGLNIDESIFDRCGNTLGNTLDVFEKTLTGGTGTTFNTLFLPSQLRNKETVGKDKEMVILSGEGRKSVLNVVPTPTDTDLGYSPSVLPSVLPTTLATYDPNYSDFGEKPALFDEDKNIIPISAAIFKLGYVCGIDEFTSTEVLMELPKGTGATAEKISAYLNDHAKDLKITRLPDGKWRRIS